MRRRLRAIALARRGWHVHATDTVESMLARARANAAAAGVGDRITFGLADAHGSRSGLRASTSSWRSA
jgi:23S rRNA G2445 N2-methylase RlmL